MNEEKIDYKDSISLQAYFEDKFLNNDKALILAFESLKIRLESIDKATEVARVSMEKRLEGMNEFRQALKEQAGQFITRTEHEIVRQDIRELRESRAELQGRASMSSVLIAYALTFISLVIGIINIFKSW